MSYQPLGGLGRSSGRFYRGRSNGSLLHCQKRSDPVVSYSTIGTEIQQTAIRPRMPWYLAFIPLALTSIICTACGSNVQPVLSYKPIILPVELSVSPSGITIGGSSSLVTPIGTFSIGAHYLLSPPNNQSIYVILRNRHTGYDHIFEVHSGTDQLTAVVNGVTSINVSNDQVVVDVTAGVIEKITFKQTSQIAEQQKAGWAANRWDEGWKQSWYKPFALTKWAYSDSTIEKWYGAGFIWFLLRLIFAIVLFFVDAILSFGFLIGQVFFIFFGPIGRNVVYGLMVLVVTILAAVGAAFIYDEW